tara:strand:+ start:160 stop:543 length:384 start_codon:yes stop_codon:yes gene_type:complete
MEDELIKFETAKLAKEKGFNIPCKKSYWVNPDGEFWLTSYNYNEFRYLSRPWLLAPTQTLLQRWLREVHKIHVENNHEGNDTFICRVSEGNNIGRSFVSKLSERHGFSKVLEEGLQGALKLIEDNYE